MVLATMLLTVLIIILVARLWPFDPLSKRIGRTSFGQKSTFDGDRCLGCEPVAILQYACAQDHHQDLIVGDACVFIPGIHGIEHRDDLLFIEKRHGGENWAAKRVLHESAQPAVRIESSRRAQEWMLGPTINSVGDETSRGLSEDEFLRRAADFLRYGLGTHHFD